MSTAVDLGPVEQILERYQPTRSALIEVLQDAQDIYQYLPEPVIKMVAARLRVPLIEVCRVANFYKTFTLTPRGRHVLTVCTGTACHVRGADRLLSEAGAHFDIAPGQTTEDGSFTVETVNCVGACALGPVAILDKEYHSHMDGAKLRALVHSVEKQDPES